jgi:penicillin-binding protein 1A
VTLRTATVYSVNTVYARLIMRVGPKKVVDVARRMGITTPIAPEPAIALGGLDRGVSPLEMASAFGTIANKGSHVSPTAVSRVTDSEDAVVWQPERTGTRAISEQNAAVLGDVLHEVYDKGTGVGAKYGSWGAVKTGTAQSWRDAWIVGYADDLATAVWIGYPQAQVEMTNVRGIAVTGGSYPAQVWKRFMEASSRRTAAPNVTAAVDSSATAVPGAGYAAYRVCAQSFKIATALCTDTMDLVMQEGQMPADTCPLKH